MRAQWRRGPPRLARVKSTPRAARTRRGDHRSSRGLQAFATGTRPAAATPALPIGGQAGLGPTLLSKRERRGDDRQYRCEHQHSPEGRQEQIHSGRPKDHPGDEPSRCAAEAAASHCAIRTQRGREQVVQQPDGRAGEAGPHQAEQADGYDRSDDECCCAREGARDERPARGHRCPILEKQNRTSAGRDDVAIRISVRAGVQGSSSRSRNPQSLPVELCDGSSRRPRAALPSLTPAADASYTKRCERGGGYFD